MSYVAMAKRIEAMQKTIAAHEKVRKWLIEQHSYGLVEIEFLRVRLMQYEKDQAPLRNPARYPDKEHKQ